MICVCVCVFTCRIQEECDFSLQSWLFFSLSIFPHFIFTAKLHIFYVLKENFLFFSVGGGAGDSKIEFMESEQNVCFAAAKIITHPLNMLMQINFFFKCNKIFSFAEMYVLPEILHCIKTHSNMLLLVIVKLDILLCFMHSRNQH